MCTTFNYQYLVISWSCMTKTSDNKNTCFCALIKCITILYLDSKLNGKILLYTCKYFLMFDTIWFYQVIVCINFVGIVGNHVMMTIIIQYLEAVEPKLPITKNTCSCALINCKIILYLDSKLNGKILYTCKYFLMFWHN